MKLSRRAPVLRGIGNVDRYVDAYAAGSNESPSGREQAEADKEPADGKKPVSHLAFEVRDVDGRSMAVIRDVTLLFRHRDSRVGAERCQQNSPGQEAAEPAHDKEDSEKLPAKGDSARS